MDDNHIDDLITRACHRRLDPQIPPEEFFEVVATRFTARRHRRLLTPFSIAASVALLLFGAGSLLYLNPCYDTASASASTLSNTSIYLESVSHIQDRIDHICETQEELRASIDHEFPFFDTTPQ